MNLRRFHITPRSALAGFLLLGGIQALIVGAREPLNAVAIAAFHRIAGSDSARLREMTINWTYFWGEMVIGLILVALAIGFGASALRRKSAS